MIFTVLQTYPFKMNITLEIRKTKKDGDSLILDLPLFPMLPHPQSACSTKPYTF